MKDVQQRLLGAIRLWPGEFSVEVHAHDLGIDLTEAIKAGYKLSEAGHLLPRAYRLTGYARRLLDNHLRDIPSLLGHGAFQQRTWEKAASWIERLYREGSFENDGSLSGADKVLLERLNLYGLVSLPECLWPAFDLEVSR